MLTQFKFTFCKCRVCHQINPNDPAVIPTVTKKANSSNPWADAGVDINILLKYDRTDGSIEIDVCAEYTKEK